MGISYRFCLLQPETRKESSPKRPSHVEGQAALANPHTFLIINVSFTEEEQHKSHIMMFGARLCVVLDINNCSAENFNLSFFS